MLIEPQIDPLAVYVDGSRAFDNTGLHILDADASHELIISAGSDLTAERTLTLTTGDSNRTITLSGNPTLGDWFDQSVKEAATPRFAQLGVGTAVNSLNGILSGGAYTSTVGYTGIASAWGFDYDDPMTSAGDYIGIDGTINKTGSGDLTGSIIGIKASALSYAPGDLGNVTSMTGVQAVVSYGTATAGNTLTELRGIHVPAFIDPASATITTAYGLHLESVSVATTNWAIYSEGGDSYHAGDLAFGQTDKTERIGSDADGFLDLRAGTNIRLNQIPDFNYASGASTKNPETDPEDEWLEIEMEGITYYVPLYAAS